jgi:PadR family transcriptional regulator, regulatory protein AphA
MSRVTLTPSSYAVLGFLARQPGSGYELGTRAASSVDQFWPLTRTHIYGELAKLEALGFVTGVEVEQQHLPDKRVYSLTREGERVLQAWLADPDPGTPRPRQPMLVKLYFGEHLSVAQARTLLVRYREQARERRDRYAADVAADTAALAADPESPRRFGRAAALFGLRRAEADLIWVEEVWAELRTLDMGVDTTVDEPG